MLYYRSLILLLAILLPATCGRQALRQNLFASPVPPLEGTFTAQLHPDEESLDPDFLKSAIPLDWVFEGQSRNMALEDLFQRLAKTHDFSGTVLIAEQGHIVHAGAYGLANQATGEQINLHTSFQLASVSKTITALAILRLYEAGKVGLDDPVQRYLQEFPYPNITVRHLLTHRSGMCRYMGLAHEHWDKRYYLTTQQVVELFAEHHPVLRYRPGARFQYNNTNYVMLAAIIERVSGQVFETFLEEEIFAPLGMHHTAAYNILEHRNKPGQARGYIRKHRRYVPAEGDYLDAAMGDKGIYSTVGDLFTLDQALYTGRLLTPATTQLAFDLGRSHYQGRTYGLGWRLKRRMPQVAYHFGWWRGFRSCFIRDMENQRTLIMLSNRVHAEKTINYWEIFRLTEKLASTPVSGNKSF